MSGWARKAEMSGRARGYLSLLAFRHLGIGVICLSLGYVFESPSFRVIKLWAPIKVWGVILLLVGSMALSAVFLGRERYARLSIILSLALTSIWAGAFVTDALIYTDPHHPGVASPVWAVTWVTLCGKDLILAAMPLRSPFEYLVYPDEVKQVSKRSLF